MGTTAMIGKSGRIVIEIEPEMKQRLYSVLASRGLNLKEWFIEHVDDYLDNYGQMDLSMTKHKQPCDAKAEK